MKESILQNKNMRGLRFWARGILWGICTLLGLAACLAHLIPYYEWWILKNPFYGFSFLFLVYFQYTLPMLAASVFSASIGRWFLKACSVYTTAALLLTNINLFFYPLYYLDMKVNFGFNDYMEVLFHISAVIGILAIIGLAVDSVRLLRKVWKARKTRQENGNC